MSYKAIHALYAEAMIKMQKPYLKYSQFCAIRRAELPGLVHMRSTVLARFEFCKEVTSLQKILRSTDAQYAQRILLKGLILAPLQNVLSN